MTTKLDKPLKREVQIGDKAYTLTIDPAGLKLVEKGHRKGVEVERKARPIAVHEAELLAFDEQTQQGRIRFLCSKGTYVRTLAHDIGQALGCGACLDALRRTRSGTFDVKDALPFDEILKLTSDQLAARVIPLARATRPDTP